MLTCWRARPVFPTGSSNFRGGLCCRAEDPTVNLGDQRQSKKKVLIVGSGWAGLGAAHHLCKQVFLILFYFLSGKNMLLFPVLIKGC